MDKFCLDNFDGLLLLIWEHGQEKDNLNKKRGEQVSPFPTKSAEIVLNDSVSLT